MSQNLNPLTNGSYWGPIGETAEEITFEKLFLVSCYLSGIGFGKNPVVSEQSRAQLIFPLGMQFILYLGCLQVLWRGARTRYTWFLMIYSTLLCITNMLYTVDGYIIVQLAYIGNRNFPGGVVGFIGASVSLAPSIISITSIVAGIFLADMLLVRLLFMSDLALR
jgi:hypothetical protein